jgi:hypothetical protein
VVRCRYCNTNNSASSSRCSHCSAPLQWSHFLHSQLLFNLHAFSLSHPPQTPHFFRKCAKS